MLSVSALSTQYIPAQVSATKAGVSYNPTSDAVFMAFKQGNVQPSAGDWVAGVWDTAGTAYYALCLVGPSGGITLTAGVWNVWVKVTDNPEIPVFLAGQIQVY